MDQHFARRKGRNVWVNVVKPAFPEDEVALLESLESAEADLDETDQLEETILADIRTLEQFINGGYTGNVTLATVDYVLQIFYYKFALRVHRDYHSHQDDYFVRFDEAEGVWFATDDGEPTRCDWADVMNNVRSYPISIAALERTPWEAAEDLPLAERSWSLQGSGVDSEVELLQRTDWDGLEDPCPECGHTEFDHVHTSGGHYGQGPDGTPVCRADFNNLRLTLLTTCKNCDEVLFKHPSADLLLDWTGTNEETVVRP